MNFTHHNYLGDLELQKKETNGIRLYNLPDGQWVPSITSVTSFYNRQIFIDWRKRVGVEEANKITKKATARGTDYHEAAQNYLMNLELNWDDYQPMTKFMFYNTLPYLDKINNIHAIERTLYSEYLGLAGRVDCIAEYEGELAVIDFKTSTKIKPEKWCTNYFVQEMFYAAAYYELTEIDAGDDVDNFAITRLGYDYDMIAPISVPTGTLGTSCNLAGEAYEGVLVTLSDVEIMGFENSYGEIEIDDGSGATQLEDDLMDTAEHFADSFCSDNYVGEVIPTLVGVVDYSWSS